MLSIALVASVAISVGGVAYAGGPPPVPGSALVPGTPCTVTAEACVDLAGHTAWLLRDGQVVRGPVGMSDGGPENQTPRGTFGVEWKNKNHVSLEYNAPMPYAVFFAPGGIAFHEGSLRTTSAGCVRLARADAAAFYDYLQVGDEVQVK